MSRLACKLLRTQVWPARHLAHGSVRYGLDEGRTEAIPTFEMCGDSGLTAFPAVVTQQAFLREVKLARNAITELPDGLGEMSNLALLDVSYNALRSLSPAVARLSSLENLNVAGNELSGDEAWPASLPASLHTLNAAGAGLESVPDAIATLSAVMTLNLASNALTVLGCGVDGGWARLHTLDVSRNLLCSLPDELGSLSSLMFLNASYNALQSVPASVGELDRLVTLNVAHNELASLPSSVWKLSSLRTLNASFNVIASLPCNADEMPANGSLQTVLLIGNGLQQLPWAALGSSARSLRTLELSCNPELGEDLVSEAACEVGPLLTRLTWVNMTCCGVGAWPAWLGALSALETCILWGNVGAWPDRSCASPVGSKVVTLSLGATGAGPEVLDALDAVVDQLKELDLGHNPEVDGSTLAPRVECISLAGTSGLAPNMPPEGTAADEDELAGVIDALAARWAVAARVGRREDMEDAHCVGQASVPAHAVAALGKTLATFAVFDGHMNAVASTFAAKAWEAALQEALVASCRAGDAAEDMVGAALIAALAAVEANLEAAHTGDAAGGTTAVVAVLYAPPGSREVRCSVANVGDSRAAVVDAAGGCFG
ncbi:leucine-rich repeat protein [Thecamonas trahens ATCC 50062]|uniref:Leucine-rich repeat protein n=1 Tax=Thecamonas trahens ATCC 50062 TaxID=461836 RepID=A0A0L0DTS9_THETB|nr:leucine-rich repeat protein [Thecamonas trahens ATCC 50062]KNC55602.1 leucine-rich repeat protein [Thecamonas trahens ATCC 50062]|eukprot:XP_013761375.1 leucine-rich repeat protein [Thecamonas trahens ATCC 50062]